MVKTKRKTAGSKKKMSFATKAMVVINIFFICLLLLSYLSLYISPEKFWPLAFAGLAYPVTLLCNVFFVLFWLVFIKKYFILSLITILLGYNQVKTYIKVSGSGPTLFTEKSIKLMSYNVRLFDLYNWRETSSTNTRAAIFGLIAAESADILCLQEYYSGAGKKADFGDTICIQSGYKYRDIVLINKEHARLPYGLAIFSKYPIVKTQKLDFPNSKVNFCQSVDVKIGKDTLRVLNLHLESVKFGKEDYNFVSEIKTTTGTNENIKKGSLAIIAKMKYAYMRRASQINTVAGFIKSSPYPVLMAGDFNDTPVSYSYRQIENILDDTFVDAGKGLGQTHSQLLPLLRIDYIFHSDELKTIEHTTLDKNFSDHFPVVARFMISQ